VTSITIVSALHDNRTQFLMCIGQCIFVITEEQEPTRCCLLFYCTYDRLNMFRALLCPSSGAHDFSADYHVIAL